MHSLLCAKCLAYRIGICTKRLDRPACVLNFVIDFSLFKLITSTIIFYNKSCSWWHKKAKCLYFTHYPKIVSRWLNYGFVSSTAYYSTFFKHTLLLFFMTAISTPLSEMMLPCSVFPHTIKMPTLICNWVWSVVVNNIERYY
jgi:hypothetical protein